MVCTANDLLGWKDFPKGLRVLLLDEDAISANEIRSKLEEMDYVVSTFHNESEALWAISDDPKRFHVAIVEIREENGEGRFKFLENAKELPTIMTSDVKCISTMMKCIALGAVEFLEKPLSEDKLRNIWQHVAHKAFKTGPRDPPEKKEVKEEAMFETQSQTQEQEHIEATLAESDEYPAPSTPQLEQGMRLVNNGDCQDHDHDQTNVSTEKDCMEHDVESKFVENTSKPEGEKVKDCAHPGDGDCRVEGGSDCKNQKEAFERPRTKSNRRKIKVDWTPDLHKKFVQAVEQLGVEQAIPSRILELMNVEGLTRHNIASHLQKYRLQRRHILPKDGGRKWQHPRQPSTAPPRNYYAQKPIVAYPPRSQVYPSWVPPPPPMWGAPYYPGWQPPESWHWNLYPGVHGDAWGCLMMPPPPPPSFSQNVSQFQIARDSVHNNQIMPNNSCEQYPGDEVIDKVVKEAINKPWLPLPLGLKPPSTESVISELSKQGISTVPPRAHPC